MSEEAMTEKAVELENVLVSKGNLSEALAMLEQELNVLYESIGPVLLRSDEDPKAVGPDVKDSSDVREWIDRAIINVDELRRKCVSVRRRVDL